MAIKGVAILAFVCFTICASVSNFQNMEMGAKGSQKLIRREKKQASASEGKSVGAQQKTMPTVMKQGLEARKAAMIRREEGRNDPVRGDRPLGGFGTKCGETGGGDCCGKNAFIHGNEGIIPGRYYGGEVLDMKPTADVTQTNKNAEGWNANDCGSGKQCCRPFALTCNKAKLALYGYPSYLDCSDYDKLECRDNCDALNTCSGANCPDEDGWLTWEVVNYSPR